MLLRTATKLQHFGARQNEKRRGRSGVCNSSHVVYLIATLVAFDIANSCQTPAPRSY
ncbi:hypothetical protein [Pilibacter termitis]|uniref:hypothetical protein n=1 Tax=Pilibacter termitis TaxID=263852 RepID=UPI001356406E|nr:hypothetical protein [Pilibacter termitis]